MFRFLRKKLRTFFKKSSAKIAEAGKKEKPEEKKPEKLEKPKKVGEAKKGIIRKIKEKITTIKLDKKNFNSFWTQLEFLFIENNVALSVTDKIREKLEEELVNKEMKKNEIEKEIKNALRKALSTLLLKPFSLIEKIKKSSGPYVIVFFGINGSGKTTTIAKICRLLQKNNLGCVMAASDTFRAASIEQLGKHASKLGVKVIKHGYGADPAAVAYDAVAYAKSHGIDVVLIDTAGRMHTQENLMREMEKICRVNRPNLKIFVGEATTGNDAVIQAEAFNKAVGIDVIILAKQDVDERGGTAISISYTTGKPILFLGIGQKLTDLEKFDKEKLLRQLGL